MKNSTVNLINNNLYQVLWVSDVGSERTDFFEAALDEELEEHLSMYYPTWVSYVRLGTYQFKIKMY